MKLTKATTLLLAILLLFTACGGGKTETPSGAQTAPASDTTAEATEAVTTAYYDVTGIDYNGYAFYIWNEDNLKDNNWTGFPNDMFVEGETGEILNDAVYTRNRAVEEKLNITIKGEDVPSNTFPTKLTPRVAAGDKGLDLLTPVTRMIPKLVSAETVYDVNTLKAFDLSEPWWNRNCNEEMTIHGKLFALTSDATYYDKLSTVVTFFNQKLVTDNKMEDPYDLVDSDKWTLDKALEMGAVISADVNADNIRDEKDAYPISCQNDGSYYLLHAAGVTICSKDAKGNLIFNLNEERSVSVLQKIYTLMTDKTKYYNRLTYNKDLTLTVNMFNEGRALFLIRPLQTLFVMREMESDFGIVPMPKIDDQQKEFRSAVNCYAGTCCMLPKTTDDPERSAVVLSLLSCESHYTVMDTLYSFVLGDKLLRDESSRNALEVAFAGAVCDPGLLWDFGGIQTTLLKKNDTDVASMLASVTPTVNKAIEDLNEQLAK